MPSRISPPADRPTSTNSPWPAPTENRLITHDGWTTHIREDGRVEWMPPPLLDTGQDRINHYWHPEELFHPPEHDDP